ncbi:MAG: hypothetical protein ACRD52_00530, partial [Candidatus Acidiferrales bacterium]
MLEWFLFHNYEGKAMNHNLDWNRLRSGNYRALYPEHQDIFDTFRDLSAQLEVARMKADQPGLTIPMIDASRTSQHERIVAELLRM